MATVGYYAMTLGQGSVVQQDEIQDSGDIAVNVVDLSAAELDGLDALYVVNPSNGGIGSEFSTNLGNITDAVNDGMNLIIFDRYVAGNGSTAAADLPGGTNITLVRTVGTDVDVAAGAPSTFTNGPNGVIDDTTFDGGNFSTHGYATLASLPPGAVPLLTTGDPNQIVAFSYPLGSGMVFYATIPLDFYSGSNNAAITPAEIVSLFGNVQDTLCFAAGTLITTPQGDRAVEDLRGDDPVCTKDGTQHPIRWIKGSHVTKAALQASPNLRPVRITAGALGCGLPRRDLVVSRQHRVLVSSKIAGRMFGEHDVLIAAIKLTDLPGIFVDDAMTEVSYFHVMFDAHQIVLSEGAATESLFTGPQALKAVPRAARKELEALFPELTSAGYAPYPAALIPKGSAQKQLVMRHCKNNKPPVDHAPL
jgi:hypothetical protein